MAEYRGMRVDIDEGHTQNLILAPELADFLQHFRAAYMAVLKTQMVSVKEDNLSVGIVDEQDLQLADNFADIDLMAFFGPLVT
jgi:hypothetical protein